MKKHLFNFDIVHWPRSLNRQEYEKIARWLRICRSIVNPKVMDRVSKIHIRAMSDNMVVAKVMDNTLIIEDLF